jgi:hypothetical protein
MAIQYSGNAQTSTFIPTNKQDIINAVGAALLAAGWTTASGGTGTTNWMLTSATTPQGCAINVRMKDNGGVCVSFSLESTDGVLVGTNSTTVAGGYLNPGSSLTFRIVCNKYQAFIYVTPPTTPARGFVAFGVPWMPTWMASVTTRIGWMWGNSSTDTTTTIGVTPRTGLFQSSTGTSNFAQQAMYNSNIWSINSSVNANGCLGLIPVGVAFSGAVLACQYWETGHSVLSDALIGWGAAAPPTPVAKLKGMLWDAVISSDTTAGDLTTTFDSHNWIVVTDNNAASGVNGRGTLVVATS